ncbi:MAG: M48 family metalloprotease [Candidatus Omnitrophota bacterium]
MRRFVRYIPYVLVVVLAIIIVQCAVNPVTGKKEIMLVSENQEINMGAEIDRGLRMEYGMYDDPKLRDYITEIGEQMAPLTHRPNLKYHFAVLDTPVENAFAAPGGYIYITRGLLALMNSEAEMATVIGHELGHVNARHSAQQMTRSILFTIGIAVVSELSKDFRKIAPLTLIATQLLFLKYSRDNEYQADELGFNYSLKSGFNSGEMVTFFSTLDRMVANEGGSSLPNFLSTHPMTPKRIEKVKGYIQAQELANPGQLAKLKIDRKRYCKMIDGLVYGDDPRQGFVEGNAFYHPAMGISFKIPSGWKVQNTPLQVTMASDQGNVLVLMKAEESNDELEDYSQKLMKNLSEPKVLNQGHQAVNGMNAFHSALQITSQPSESDAAKGAKPQKTNVNISCIRKDEMIYSFFSVAAEKDWRHCRDEVREVIGSFKPLKNTKYLNRQPQRVYVKEVQGNSTLQEYLVDQHIPRQDWDRIALMNCLQLNDRLSSHRLLKVIQ